MNTLGNLLITEIKDNPDGSCIVTFDLSEEFQQNLMKYLGWSEWSTEKFNDWIVKSLTDYANEVTNGTNDDGQ
jgi:hypothetical protein